VLDERRRPAVIRIDARWAGSGTCGIVPPVRIPLRVGDPRQLGAYEVLSRLGQGGMGTVFLGRSASGRLVAIKVIRAEYADEDEFRGRFRSEVTRARQVPPFCTAEVLDADPEHRTPYLVVEFVDGPSLAEVVEDQGPLAAGNLHSVAIGVATALAAIHGAGVIHRDLKPRNVLFALGIPKVIDFGIARALEVTSQHTHTDQMVGTVAYMAPERFDGTSRAVTPAADVFAWGAVVGYAATGRTPFGADSAAATAARILTQPPVLNGLSGPLRDLVALSLEKEPQNRPSAHELLDLLLAAGPQELTAGLAARPELRQAVEAAQHSGRHPTGDPWPDDVAPGNKTRTGRTRKIVLSGLALVVGLVLAAWAAGVVLASSPTPEQPVVASPAAVDPSAAAAPKRTVAGPSVIDGLTRPGQWKATRDGSGRCQFSAGTLVASTADVAYYKCAGPDDLFAGDQSVAVDATVLAPGSCAEIWFRLVARSGYRVSACAGELRVELDDDGAVKVLSREPLAAFTIGRRHRLTISVHDELAVVGVDGTEAGRAAVADPTLAAGQVVLGVTADGAGSQGKVAFANAELRSL
jgi:serine/threonine protein kinase